MVNSGRYTAGPRYTTNIQTVREASEQRIGTHAGRETALHLRADVAEATLELAVEIAREGREGRRIEPLFTLGSADDAIRLSQPLTSTLWWLLPNRFAMSRTRTSAGPSKNWLNSMDRSSLMAMASSWPRAAPSTPQPQV